MTDLFGVYTQMMLVKFSLQDFTACIIFFINHSDITNGSSVRTILISRVRGFR